MITTVKWLVVSALAVVLSISLLVALKFTGFMDKPLQPEIITLDPVSWETERPSEIVTLDQKIKNHYSSDELQMNITLHILEYFENALTYPYNGKDGISFSINLAVQGGHRSCLMVRCSPEDANSTIILNSNDWGLKLSNASLRKIQYLGTDDKEAYIQAETSSSWCFLNSLIHWVFKDENTEGHQMNVTTEVVHFNGTTHKKIIAPMRLQIRSCI